MPDQATRNQIQELLNRIQDAYFDYDEHNPRPDAQHALVADARTLGEILKQHPGYKLSVHCYCDERGLEEYDMALGDRRAHRLCKEKQVCSEHDEACWQKNRRAHITQEQ